MAGDRIVGGLDIDTYTDAPLRVCCMAFLDTPPRKVFDLIRDHTSLNRWMPLVSQLYVNRGHADTQDGVGTIRYLHFGALYTLREYVIAFDPPHLIAVSIEQDPWFANHVGVLLLEAERYGGTNLTWQHYFRTSPTFLEPALAGLVSLWVAGAQRNLIARFGGRLLSEE